MQSIATTQPETRWLMQDISWDQYVEIADARRGSVPRMTYDGGALEVMSPGKLHENLGSLLGRLVETFSEVRDIEIESVASTTFKRKDVSKAFEADES